MSLRSRAALFQGTVKQPFFRRVSMVQKRVLVAFRNPLRGSLMPLGVRWLNHHSHVSHPSGWRWWHPDNLVHISTDLRLC